MRLFTALLASLLLLSACAEAPLRKDEPLALPGNGPQATVEYFRVKTPDKFSGFNSIVFEIAGQKFLGMGFVEIDRKQRSFRVICLNPMGVKLFDLSGDDHGAVLNYAIEPLAQQGDIAAAVANDIRRAYLDLVPNAAATPRVDKQSITYGGGTPAGYVEHIFAKNEGNLVEKRLYDEQLISWSVAYSAYRENGGMRTPGNIVITDYKNGYQLTIREKEQSIAEDKE